MSNRRATPRRTAAACTKVWELGFANGRGSRSQFDFRFAIHDTASIDQLPGNQGHHSFSRHILNGINSVLLTQPCPHGLSSFRQFRTGAVTIVVAAVGSMRSISATLRSSGS